MKRNARALFHPLAATAKPLRSGPLGGTPFVDIPGQTTKRDHQNWGRSDLFDLGTKRLIDALRCYLLAEIAYHSGDAGLSNSNTILYINIGNTSLKSF
jgi:hypothetical protein